MAAGGKRFRVALDRGEHFYLAGIWEPAMGDWPLSYRVITVAANLEVVPYQDRHGVIIHRRQVMQWLDRAVAEITPDDGAARAQRRVGSKAMVPSSLLRT